MWSNLQIVLWKFHRWPQALRPCSILGRQTDAEGPQKKILTYHVSIINFVSSRSPLKILENYKFQFQVIKIFVDRHQKFFLKL